MQKKQVYVVYMIYIYIDNVDVVYNIWYMICIIWYRIFDKWYLWFLCKNVSIMMMLYDHMQYLSRWWEQIFFIFTPYLEKWSNLTNIFQMGWNHQLVIYIYKYAHGMIYAHTSTIYHTPWEGGSLISRDLFCLRNDCELTMVARGKKIVWVCFHPFWSCDLIPMRKPSYLLRSSWTSYHCFR